MGTTVEDMDVQVEQKDSKVEFLKNQIGLADSKFTEKVNELGLNKISFKRKRDRIMDRLKRSFNDHKYIKNTSLLTARIANIKKQ